jgi:hypothetical protein
MAKLNVDIKPRGTASAYVEAPFDQGKEMLAKAGYRVISLQETAQLRMQEGSSAYVSQNGNWVREGAIYVPNKGAYLTKNSPIMENAAEATNCHRKGIDFYLTPEQVEKSLTGAVKLSGDSIPTNRFKDNEATVYAFGEDAEKYGQFLREAGIKDMPVYLANTQDKSFARQVWFGWLGDLSRSGLVGYGRFLDGGDYGVRGVQDSAEGTAKNFEAYTPAQIAKVLKSKGLSGIEKTVIESLRQ